MTPKLWIAAGLAFGSVRADPASPIACGVIVKERQAP
jgi:hypothetical protein